MRTYTGRAKCITFPRSNVYYLSNSADMSFEEAVALIGDALRRHHFAILAEIDLSKVLRKQLAVDLRPYVIISACSPQSVPQAIEADNEIGSILLCNLAIQQHGDGRVEISVADPAAPHRLACRRL